MSKMKGFWGALLALMLLLTAVTPVEAATQSWKVVGGLHFSGGSTNDTNLALDSSGTPYVAYEDDSDGYMRIRVKKFNRVSNTWDNVGDYIDSNGSTDLDFTIDSGDVPYVAYKNPSSQKACVVRFDGANWLAVGPLNFSAGAIDNISIDTDSQGTPYVSYHDNSLARVVVVKYAGAAWSMVGGSPVSSNPGRYTNLAFSDDDELFVEYQLVTNSNIMVHRLSEGFWLTVGATGAVGDSENCGFAVDRSGNPCFIFSNAAASRLPSVRRWDGAAWITLGTISNAYSTYEPSIAIDNSNTIYIAYTNTSGSAMVQKWNGSSWVTVGTGPVTGRAEQLSLSITGDGILYLGIKNNDSGYDPAVYGYDYTYSLNYSAGSHGSITGTATQAVDRGGSGTAVEAVANDGYHFVQWSDGVLNASRTDINVSADISVTAQFEINSYTVHYDANGGIGTMVDDIPNYGDSFALTNVFTRLGYTFAGWAISEDGLVVYSDGETVQNLTMVNGDTVTLYAQWAKEEYSISYDLDGGTVDEANPTTYDVDSEAITLHNPTKEDYVFAGWSGTGITGLVGTVTIPTGSTGNRSYTANWNVATVTVTFNTQGGTAVSPVIANFNTIIAAPTPPIRSGYAFQGWYKEASCTNAWNFATDKVTTDITLYAMWASTTPVAVKAVSASYTSVKVTWNAVPGASGYQVYSATSSAGPWALKGTVTTPSFSNTGLVTGKTYYYKVRSYNAAKVYSAYSSVVSARPIPATPYSVKATAASYNSAKVSWVAVSGATRYEVYRATSSTGSYSLVGTTTTIGFTNTGLRTGSPYYYKVRCYHLEGSAKVYSAFSTVVSVKTAIGTPGSVRAARSSSTSIRVTWGRVTGATRYELWRSTSSGGTYTLVAATSSLYYTNTKLTTGRVYYYKVRAYRLEGSTKVYGPWSPVVYAKP